MEKLGVEAHQLVAELREKFNELKERKSCLLKTSGESSVLDLDLQLNQIQGKIDELCKQHNL